MLRTTDDRILCQSQDQPKCELRDVIQSFTHALLDLRFFLKMVANSVSYILLISLILVKFRYWQEIWNSVPGRASTGYGMAEEWACLAEIAAV